MTQYRLQKLAAFAEFTDGAEHGPARVTFAARTKAQRTARARKWDVGTDPRFDALCAYFAFTETGSIAYSDFETFLADVVDVQVVVIDKGDTPEPEDDDDDEAGPTRPAAPDMP